LALGTGQVGILLGLGDHTKAVLGLTRAIGVFTIAIIVTFLLLAVLRGRLHPVGGLGVALGMTVLLFPVVQPWYVLWAVIPLAEWATRPAFRTTTIVVTLVVGIFGPTANGDRFTLFQILLAVVASTVIVLILIGLTYYRLPWRKLPDAGGARVAPPPSSNRQYRRRSLPSPALTLNPRDFRLPCRRLSPAMGAGGTPRANARRPSPCACAGSASGTVDDGRLRTRPGRPGCGSARAARAQRCGQDHYGGDVRGLHQARRGQNRDPRLDPVTDNARVRERIGVMLQGGGGYPAARAGEMLNLVAAYAATRSTRNG